MSNLVFVFAAYTLVWLLVVGYVVVLARRQAELKGELDELERALERRIAGEKNK